MSKQWVADASPLILLQKIEQLPLLTALCDKLVIPYGVVQELSHKGDELRWQLFLGAFPNIEQLSKPAPIHPGVSGWDLGKGESEAISFAIENQGYEVILDDLSARKCAETFKIPSRGTVGVILLAKKRKIIPEAKPLIEALKTAGLWFTDDWIKHALSLVGEAY